MTKPLEKYDYLLKLIVIGDTGAGKSCLLYHFIENRFKTGSNHTIGVEFGSKILEVGGHELKLQIWDTAGQERFRSVTRSYYRGATGCLLVYDVTNRESFEAVPRWLQDARSLSGDDVVIVLVGNKTDREEDRQVPRLEAANFAQEHDCAFLEASALSGENVQEVFAKCARSVLTKLESGLLNPDLVTPGTGASGRKVSSQRKQRIYNELDDTGSNCKCG
eukprot:Rmarinus@m.15809